ncbi:MAG: hypothetical protein ABJI43_04050, partial [Roseobacter sp.]
MSLIGVSAIRSGLSNRPSRGAVRSAVAPLEIIRFAIDSGPSKKRNRFSEEQIIGIFKEHEVGVPVADLCR